MKSAKKNTVVFAALFAVTIVFIFAIVCLAIFLPSDPYEDAVPDNGMSITDMDVRIEWADDRSCRVEERIVVAFRESSHGIYVDIPVNSGEKVRDLKVSPYAPSRSSVPYSVEYEAMFDIVRIVVGDSGRLFTSGQSLVCEVSYDYITPVHPDGANILDINAVGGGWTCDIDRVTVAVSFPEAPAARSGGYGVFVGDEKASGVIESDGGKTFTFSATDVPAFTSVRFKYLMADGVLKTHFDAEWVAPVIVGALLVAAAILLMIFVGRDKPPTPVASFFPPEIDSGNGRRRRMLPVQMGKIIDGDCSSADVTSLIFYWASEKYLEIEDVEGEISFIKLRELDAVTGYEKKMFDALFQNAPTRDDGTIKVSLSSLRGKFAGSIGYVRNAVNSEYRGKLYKPAYTALAVGVGLCALIYGVLFAMLSSFRVASGLINFVGIVAAIPVVLAFAAGTVLSRQYLKLPQKKRALFTALLFVVSAAVAAATSVAIPSSAASFAEKAAFAVAVGITSAIAPFLTRRKKEYTDSLCEIIGFRDFLRDAEKERLEMLLKDDPQYYYDILPYANVLGVSDIWAEKFEGLSIEPPAYYRGSNVSLFDIYLISRISGSVGSALTFTPPKVSGGSFSGGGGGHGGGSFGGFGGGGGGRW